MTDTCDTKVVWYSLRNTIIHCKCNAIMIQRYAKHDRISKEPILNDAVLRSRILQPIPHRQVGLQSKAAVPNLWSAQRRQSGLKSGGCGSGSKNLDCSRQISKKFRLFSRTFTKKFDFPRNNWPFTSISGQIILFLFKSHHFRADFLYVIIYNNISRPVHDPPTTPWTKSGGRDPPSSRIDAPGSADH